MENAKNYVIYSGDSWEIELRPRNNAHANEPNMKVWIIREGQEVAQYTNHYRGYGHYQDHEELLPADISDIAKKAWGMLTEAPFDDAMLEKMKALAE